MRRILLIFIFTAGFLLAVYNAYRCFDDSMCNISEGILNTSEGLSFHFGERQNAGLVLPAMRMIPAGAKVYLWTIPQLEKEISHECRAYKLAYYLYPSEVCYRNDAEMMSSDFIVCEKTFASQLNNRLFILDMLLGGKASFHEAYSNEEIVIFAGNGLSLLKTDSDDSRILLKRRLAICELNPALIMKALLAFGIVCALGYFTLALPCFRKIRNALSWGGIVPLSFLAGCGMLGVSLFYLSLLGVQINLKNCLILVSSEIFMAAMLSVLLEKKGNQEFKEGVIAPAQHAADLKKSPVIAAVLSLKAFLLFLVVVLFLLAFSKGASDAAGQAVWGMKTRAVLSGGAFNLDFLKNNTRMYSHPDYPPLWPLLLSFLSAFSEEYNECVIKFLPLAAETLLILSIYSICRMEGLARITALLLSAIASGNYYMMQSSTMYYAEPFLALLMLWSFYMLVKYLDGRRGDIWLLSAFILLGIASLVKNEGAVIYMICSGLLLPVILKKTVDFGKNVAERKYGCLRRFLILAAPALLSFVPWFLFRNLAEIESYDFDFSIAHLRETTALFKSYSALKAVLYSFFADIRGSGAFWWVFCLVFAVNYKAVKGKASLWVLFLIALYIVVLITAFIFSVRPLDWHLRAIPRVIAVLQAPAVLVLIGLLRPRSSSKYEVLSGTIVRRRLPAPSR